MIRSTLTALGLLALCAACQPQGGEPATADAAAACADASARLPGVGLCQDEAAALIQIAEGSIAPSHPDGCVSVVNETMMIADEALIYRAARCGEATTALEFAPGAQSAILSVTTYAPAPGSEPSVDVARLFGVDPDPQGALKAALNALPADQRAVCEIRPEDREGLPADALVIAPTAAARAKMPQDEPIAACGPFGLNEDEQSYWRIRQGYAWFFTLGQDDPGFDAASLTVIVKDANGVWRVKE